MSVIDKEFPLVTLTVIGGIVECYTDEHGKASTFKSNIIFECSICKTVISNSTTMIQLINHAASHEK